MKHTPLASVSASARPERPRYYDVLLLHPPSRASRQTRRLERAGQSNPPITFRAHSRAHHRRPHCSSDPAPKNSPNSAEDPIVARPMCRTFNAPGSLYANASYVP